MSGNATPTSAIHTPTDGALFDERERMAGLSPACIAQLTAAVAHLDAQRLDAAMQASNAALAIAPDHPEALRVLGLVLNARGSHAQAIEVFRRALAISPADAPLHADLADAFRASGDAATALAVLQQACERAPASAAAWFHFGRHRMDALQANAAIEPLRRAVALAPAFAPAHTLLADALADAGDIAEAAAHFRDALRLSPSYGKAWWGLSNLKTVGFDADELQCLEALARADLTELDRVLIGFALGKGLEDAERFPEAFATLVEANARVRQRNGWDARAFTARVDATLAAFASRVATAADATFGNEAIFVVSLPRSGSTLAEQILAAHPLVEGASELGDLAAVIQAESARRRRRFPEWVGEATPDEWAEMGRAYLDRTARWRSTRPRFTDKMPNNWLFVGAIAAMLPGAHIVNCRRDPVETCWSCFKQYTPYSQDFTYDLADLAAFWRDYDRASRQWLANQPERVRDHVYEALIADPDTEIRALLAFCDLPFDPACLDFAAQKRSVRTASAAQVRQPLRPDTARAERYGALLDPLRRALGVAAR